MRGSGSRTSRPRGGRAGCSVGRDALILILVAGGLGFEDITRLCRTDLTTEDEALVVRVRERWTRIPDHGGGPVSAVAVCRRWVEVLGFLDRYPSTQLLSQRLAAGADLSRFRSHA